MKSFGDGRFRVEKKIGQGAQGLVYLARDTHLDRNVAIKVLHSQPLQALAEAQLVSRIQHPNIVTLYDAFAEHSHPCLVFEFVAGETLADLLRREKQMSPVAAVQMMVAILEGLQAAHAKGVIHRDMKPQNIILDEQGRPRIMDFGVATQRGQSYEGLTGTAGFIAPEMINNLPVDAQADVFACGVILYQMLTGKLVSDGDTVIAILFKTANEDFVPPSRFNDQIDEKLDHLVMVALFKTPEARYADAGAMRQALLDWLDSAGVVRAEGDAADGRHSTIEFLLRRMRHSADFPALSQTISAINKVDESQAEKVQSLSGVILQDFSLTNKLLKVVNSASFGQFGGAISTISRAIVILGFDRIRSLAVTILLFEHMQNKAHANRLRDVVLEIFFGGVLCRKLADKQGWRDAEEALICGMFQHLGRLLTHFYFNEESLEILKRKKQTNESESVAAEAILGVSYAELGIAIAGEWNFPERIVISMRPLPDVKVREPNNQAERLRVFSNLATELLPLVAMKPVEAAVYTQNIIKRFSVVVSWSEREVQDLLKDAAKQYLSYLSLLQIDLGQAEFATHLRTLAGVKAAPPAGEQASESVNPQEAGAEITVAANPAAMLTAGVQDITNSLVGEFNLNDVLRMILETMFRSIGFDRVLFCTRDVKKGTMVARFGFGKEIDAILPKFSFPLNPLEDVFQLVLAKNADVFIEDVDAESIAPRIPAWYRFISQAKTLMVFPVIIDKKPIGLFYADRMAAHSLSVPHDQLNLLKTLRNQAILAIRQKQMGN